MFYFKHNYTIYTGHIRGQNKIDIHVFINFNIFHCDILNLCISSFYGYWLPFGRLQTFLTCNNRTYIVIHWSVKTLVFVVTGAILEEFEDIKGIVKIRINTCNVISKFLRWLSQSSSENIIQINRILPLSNDLRERAIDCWKGY